MKSSRQCWLSWFGGFSAIFLIFVCAVVVGQGFKWQGFQVSAQVLYVLLNLLYVVFTINAGLLVWTDLRSGMEKTKAVRNPTSESTDTNRTETQTNEHTVP